MRHLNFISYLFILSCLAFNITSCRVDNSNAGKRLNTAEQIMEQDPDSALSILDSISDYHILNDTDYNRFILLQIQAKDKSYRNIVNDTIVFRVKDYYEKMSDTRNAALSAFYSGKVLQGQNKDEEAIKEYQVAEKYADQTNDNTLKGLIKSAVGSVFLKQFITTEAIKNLTQAIEYFKIGNNKGNEITCYNQLGNAYLMNSVDDSAFYYYQKGFELAEITKDSTQMANITQCIGIAHRQIGNFTLATDYFRTAEKYTTNNDSKAKLYLNLSKSFLEKNMPDSAKFYVNKSLETASGDKITLLALVYKTLSQIAEKQKEYNESLAYHKEYAQYLEQILDENRNTEILELQKKYKFELLHNENNRLKIKEQNNLLIFSAIVLLLGLIAIFLYKKSADSKKNILEKDNEILDAEKKIYQLIEMSNTCNEREDSIKNILYHYFDILKKAALLKSLKNENEQNYRLIRKVNEIVYGQESWNWDTFYQHMNKINDGLFERLKVKYSKLDETEFRVCCLTYANLTCSEIGVILDLRPNTIQMKRSSIRKKLGIGAQGNIQAFINENI